MVDNQDFSNWLVHEYLKWQHRLGKRGTEQKFGEYLGISAPLLSHYLNGRRLPSRARVTRLARKLGSDIYEILGLQNPDPNLRFICRSWNKLTSKQKKRLLHALDGYLADGELE